MIKGAQRNPYKCMNVMKQDALDDKIKEICKEKSKAKRSKMLLNMIASVYSRRCESYRMYLESDSPHQAIMIMCELK